VNTSAESWLVQSVVTYYLQSPVVDSLDGSTFDCPESSAIHGESCVFVPELTINADGAASCEDSMMTTSVVDFVNWGDNIQSQRVFLDIWGDNVGSRTMFSNGLIAPSFNDESELPTTEQTEAWLSYSGDIFPENKTRREYNDLDLLTYVGYESLIDSKSLTKEVSLFWVEQFLDKIVVTTPGIQTISNPITGVTQDILYGNSHIEYRYDYSDFRYGIVKVSVYTQVEGELHKFIDLSATYEEADCGPMTTERSQKYVPDPFPVCFER
jgi:hypothetical protein